MADERRIVTILFADVAGSTALGETLDPEDMRAILARYYAVAREVIEAHGGTLEKFIGDAVMAIFGLPRAHGDDAERALAATEALRRRLKAEPALAQLELRFGVSTGEVVASRERSSAARAISWSPATRSTSRRGCSRPRDSTRSCARNAPPAPPGVASRSTRRGRCSCAARRSR